VRFRYQTLLPVVISYTATINQSQHEACQNAREIPLSPNRYELLSGRSRLCFSTHTLRRNTFIAGRSVQRRLILSAVLFFFSKSWLQKFFVEDVASRFPIYWQHVVHMY